MEIWLPLERWEEQMTFWIGLRSREPKPVRLRFQPLRISGEPDWNPRWEEWHCYLFPLAVGMEDYRQLLAGYFDRVFPTRDAFDGRPMAALDLCSFNWLGAEDWQKIILAIRADMGEMSRRKRKFYDAFLRWLEAALTHTEIIVAEGNQ